MVVTSDRQTTVCERLERTVQDSRGFRTALHLRTAATVPLGNPEFPGGDGEAPRGRGIRGQVVHAGRAAHRNPLPRALLTTGSPGNNDNDYDHNDSN